MDLRRYKDSGRLILTNLSGNLSEFDVGYRIFVFAPGFQAALKGANTGDALFSEEERHTGAGGFVWSSAVENHVAVARDLFMPRFQFLPVEPNRAGYFRAFRSKLLGGA